MRFSFSTCALLAATLAFANLSFAASEARNLVQDGGFEQGGAGWAFSVNAANANGQVVDDVAHSGKKSFRLSNNSGFAPNVFGRMTQVLHGLEPFTTYRISCSVRGTNAGIVWIGGGPGWFLRATFPKGTFGWTNVTAEYTTDANPPDFELMILTESQTAAVWVDDVRMEPIKTDVARRDAILNRVKNEWNTMRSRTTALRKRVEKNPAARVDAVTQLGLAVAGRYLKRTETGTSNKLQGSAWTHLQLEEIGTVLDVTENRIRDVSLFPKPSPLHNFPVVKRHPEIRDGIFYAKMKNGAEEPFWFYGYGHFSQIIRDLPNFHSLGASLVQDGQVGPSSMNADGSLGQGAKQLLKDLRTARKNGMWIDWLLSPHYFPDWGFAKAPDLRGGGPGFLAYDIDHPVAREILEKFTGTVCDEMKDDPALFSVCLSNEPVYDQSGRTKYGRAAFIAYLESIHGRIEKLNELYGTHYANFAEVPTPGIGLKGTVNENRAYYDWVRFNMIHFAAWHGWLASIVKKHLPHTPTHAKDMVFFSLDRDKLHFGVDPELFCEATDIAGCDAYAFPTSDKTYDWMGQEFFYDLLHSFRHQPVFNSENHVIPDGAAPNHIPWTATRAQFWQGGLHHQTATTTWVWEEAIDQSLSGSIYFRPANTYGAGRAMLDLNHFAREAAAINGLAPRVALLYSPASVFWEENYKGAIFSCYRQLNFLGEPFDFVSEKELAEGRMPTNECIIAPAATHISDATAKSLREFVASGGHLLLAGTNNFKWDEYHRERGDIPHGVQLKASKNEKDSAKELRQVLSDSGVQMPIVADAQTGEPVWGVEFRRAEVNGKPVVALIEMNGENRTVKISDLKGAVVDLLSNERIDPERIFLEPMVPRLLETE